MKGDGEWIAALVILCLLAFVAGMSVGADMMYSRAVKVCARGDYR
jgi:hypothetical protein